jgi:hypothetical protein
VPKSSIAIRTPCSCSAARLLVTCGSSVSSAVSVISTVSASAGTPRRASAPVTSSTNPAARTWWAETLTLTCGRAPDARSRQCARSASARSRTQVPSGTMSPVSSAIGMNSDGGTVPRRGLNQRSSASNPVVAPLTRSTIGW